jgi:hypothetical protein
MLSGLGLNTGGATALPCPKHLAGIAIYIDASVKAGILLASGGLLPVPKALGCESTPENSRSPSGRWPGARK